jgi:hypothetical protein
MMAEKKGLGDILADKLIKLPFMPSYYLTRLLLVPLRKTVREKGVYKLGHYEVPPIAMVVLSSACAVIIFNLWIIIVLAIARPLTGLAGWVKHGLPGLAHGLIVVQTGLWIFFDVGYWHNWATLFVWWLLFLPAPLCCVHIIFAKPRAHPLQRSLDRYKSNSQGCETLINPAFVEATATARKEGYNFTFLGYDYKYKRPAIITDQERLRHVRSSAVRAAGKRHH